MVQRVSEHDLGRHGRRWHVQAIIVHEVHRMLAEDGAWARSRAENLLLTALTASSAVHSGRLFDHGRELVFHVVNDPRPDRLLDLLGEHPSLILVVLKAHGCDLIGNLALLEVLQSPKIE